jgi:adenylate kinase
VRVVLVGPPGAGKGTQAAVLSEKLGVPHISTGDLFRAHVGKQTDLGNEARRYLDAGELVPDTVTNAMVRERLAEPDMLREILAESRRRLDAVLQFDVPEDVVVERLLARGRSDDTEEVIRRRQQVYQQETAPLLDHYKDLLVTIDAVGSVEEITDRALEALRSRM